MNKIEIHSVACSEVAQSKDNALVLDVRTPAEFGDAHIEGAVLCPLGDLNVKVVEQLATGKDRCIVVCRSGARARQAAEKLAGRVSNLVVLEGGVAAWERVGLPLVRGKKAISLERQVRIIAGALVVLGILLGTFVSSVWYALSAFIGMGLVFAGITDTCAMAMVLAKMPWNNTENNACMSKSQECSYTSLSAPQSPPKETKPK